MARHGLNKVIGKPTEMPDMKRARDAAPAPAPIPSPTHLYPRIYRIVYSIQHLYCTFCIVITFREYGKPNTKRINC